MPHTRTSGIPNTGRAFVDVPWPCSRVLRGLSVIAMAHIVGAARRSGHGGNPHSTGLGSGVNPHVAPTGQGMGPEGFHTHGAVYARTVLAVGVN